MKSFTPLPKLKPGDQVAVISPSAGLPGLFPWVQDLGLERLHEIFGLLPKEYPTTRTMNAPLEDRAQDVMAAFADQNNRAVFASIGGSDQIRLVKLLRPEVFTNNPKPFFGFSDNTHLHIFLWNLGIPSYYGGSVMTQFAMNGAMHDLTVQFLTHALFETGEYEVHPSSKFTDEGLDWHFRDNLTRGRRHEPNEGLFWDKAGDAEGTLWGGCVESLIVQAAASRFLPESNDVEDAVLFLETAEDLPEDWIVQYLLRGFGERGWLEQFKAVIIGRPKAWEFDKQRTESEKVAYREGQRQTVIETVREYNSTIPILQNVDFGHTDPQICLPMGNKARITADRRLFLSY